MFIALTILMAAVAFFLVALPILGRQTSQIDPGTEASSLGELFSHRDSVFQALRELNFDHQVGKVSDADHSVFEASLKHAAADSLRAIDEWEAAADQLLDQEAESWSGKRPPSERTGTRSCPNCERPAAHEDQFCAHCGTRLQAPPTPAVKQCPKCGLSFAPGNQFCAGCGQKLSGK